MNLKTTLLLTAISVIAPAALAADITYCSNKELTGSDCYNEDFQDRVCIAIRDPARLGDKHSSFGV